MALVALDPGHGKLTKGKRSPSSMGSPQVREYLFNRQLAKETLKALERCGIDTILTVADDSDPSLTARARYAKNRGCKLFISLHANAGGGTGMEAFHMEGCDKCYRLARLVLTECTTATKSRSRGLKTKITVYTNGVARLVDSGVLAKAHAAGMAATLFEAAFMDHPKDILRLRDPAFRITVAEAICKAVCKYLGVEYHERK